MKKRFRPISIVFVPEGGGSSRSIHLSGRGVRISLILGALLLVGGLVMASSWFYLASQTSRAWRLQAQVDSLEAESVRVLVLADQLERVEAEYDRLRLLFGSAADSISPDLWLPPAGIPGRGRDFSDQAVEEDLPTTWPLTEPGFITRTLQTGDAEMDHPGLDIAIGGGSYVRAAGPGLVLRFGEDPVYGLFLVLEHTGGYQSIYAHTSMILVERGQRIRRGEVIALSGSTGQSTAPHLHFEVLLDGVPLDPLSMVVQPS
jgi:murein DD-endopeptidase MepM/ murein hydrolase activator NlpD